MKRPDITLAGISVLLICMLCSCTSMDSSVINYQYQSVRWSFCVPDSWRPEKKEDMFLDLYCGNNKIIVLTKISLQKDASSINEYPLKAKERHRQAFLEDGRYSLVEEKTFDSAGWNGVMLISQDSDDGKFWSYCFLSRDCFDMMMLVISDQYNDEIFSMIGKLIESIRIESPEIIFTPDGETVHFVTESAGSWSVEIPYESRFAVGGDRLEIYLEDNLTLMNHFAETKNGADDMDDSYRILRDKLVEKFNLKTYPHDKSNEECDVFYEGDFSQPVAVYWLRKEENCIIVSFAMKRDENQKLSPDDINVAGKIILSIKKSDPEKVLGIEEHSGNDVIQTAGGAQ
mgnify:CR=1 FL=1